MARMAARFLRPFADRRFRLLVWAVVGATGWAGLILLGATLLAQEPPHAGFDLALILDAGRRVADGQSPYLAGAVGGGTQVESLFYSYPPPVAQAASLLGGLDDAVVLAVMGLLATIGLAAVAASLAGIGRIRAVDVVVPTLALAPFTYPFAIALLFGNVDAWFPLAYGAILVAVLGGSARWRVGGGVALGLVTVAKLGPGALFVWLAVAGLGLWWAGRRGDDRDGALRATWPAPWTCLAAALATVGVVVGLSLVVGGIGPWQDYVGVLRAGSGADLVSSLNIGPASQLALLFGDPAIAARVAPILAIAALVAIAAVGRWVRPAALSLAVAAALSLVVLPITWFHYPVALVPFAVWAGVAAHGTPAAGRVGALIGAALVVAAVAIAAPVIVWVAVALVLVAVAIAPLRTVERSPVPAAATPVAG
jgi:hypothetical protein